MNTTCPKCGGVLRAKIEAGDFMIFCDGSYVPYTDPCDFKITMSDRRKQQIAIDFEERRK